jgi:hypothetical protein
MVGGGVEDVLVTVCACTTACMTITVLTNATNNACIIIVDFFAHRPFCSDEDHSYFGGGCCTTKRTTAGNAVCVG